MKMLRRKSDLRCYIKKGLIYIMICYLIASWGVHGVINPLHYIRKSNYEEVEIVDDGDYLWLDLSLTDFVEGYLSFDAYSAKRFFYEIEIEVTDENDKVEVLKCECQNGLNSLEISDGKEKKLRINKIDLDKNEVVLDKLDIGKNRRVDAVSMIYVMLSIFTLMFLWECVQYIKKKCGN